MIMDSTASPSRLKRTTLVSLETDEKADVTVVLCLQVLDGLLHGINHFSEKNS